MGMFDFAKKLIRRTYSEWGAEDGLANFPSEGHGVFVPTYLPVHENDQSATVLQMPSSVSASRKEAVNG